MAFAYTTDHNTVFGDLRVHLGTWTNGAGDSGGTIATGFNWVAYFGASITSHVNAFQPKVAISGGTVTLTTGDNVDGVWIAMGR